MLRRRQSCSSVCDTVVFRTRIIRKSASPCIVSTQAASLMLDNGLVFVKTPKCISKKAALFPCRANKATMPIESVAYICVQAPKPHCTWSGHQVWHL